MKIKSDCALERALKIQKTLIVPDHIPLYSNVDNYLRKTKYLNKYIVSLKRAQTGHFE